MNRSSSSKPPTEGAVCRVTGDLIREDVDRSPAPDMRQWAAIESLLGKDQRGRSLDRSIARWLWRLAAPALAAGAVVTWLLLEAGSSPLTYSMEGCEIGMVTSDSSQANDASHEDEAADHGDTVRNGDLSPLAHSLPPCTSLSLLIP